jgi:hypothetical protein
LRDEPLVAIERLQHRCDFWITTSEALSARLRGLHVGHADLVPAENDWPGLSARSRGTLT